MHISARGLVHLDPPAASAPHFPKASRFDAPPPRPRPGKATPTCSDLCLPEMTPLRSSCRMRLLIVSSSSSSSRLHRAVERPLLLALGHRVRVARTHTRAHGPRRTCLMEHTCAVFTGKLPAPAPLSPAAGGAEEATALPPPPPPPRSIRLSAC